MRPPKSWKELDLAQRAARRAAGPGNGRRGQQTLIHINDSLDSFDQPIEAELVPADQPPEQVCAVENGAVSLP